MLKLATAFIAAVVLAFSARVSTAAPQEYVDAAARAEGSLTPRKKKLGDVSYRTMWQLQQRVAVMLPKDARLISPVLRLSVAGMGAIERAEFKPDNWAVAIVGKTIDALVPMWRGGYFALPALPQAQSRREDAIVMFNADAKKNAFDVGWHVHVPADGTFAYAQFGQALAELARAQAGMAWWDIMLISDKTARFDAIRACFTSEQGEILVGGVRAGRKLSPHCTLLPYDPAQARVNADMAFVGGLDFVALDNSALYNSATTVAAQQQQRVH